MRYPLIASYKNAPTLTTFRAAVYRIVARIPKGKVMTYGAVAKRAGFPKAARAVGTAMSENQYRDVPCHRVVRSDGGIGEYAFGGSRAKSLRLKREGVSVVRDRVVFPG